MDSCLQFRPDGQRQAVSEMSEASLKKTGAILNSFLQEGRMQFILAAAFGNRSAFAAITPDSYAL